MCIESIKTFFAKTYKAMKVAFIATAGVAGIVALGLLAIPLATGYLLVDKETGEVFKEVIGDTTVGKAPKKFTTLEKAKVLAKVSIGYSSKRSILGNVASFVKHYSLIAIAAAPVALAVSLLGVPFATGYAISSGVISLMPVLSVLRGFTNPLVAMTLAAKAGK